MARPNVPPEMRRRIHPAVFVGATACALVILAVLMWKAATDKPVYPGLNAPHPAAEMRGFRGMGGPRGGFPGTGGPGGRKARGASPAPP